MRLALLVSLLVSAGSSAGAPAPPLERIVAVVDRTPILLSEVRARARSLQRRAERQHEALPAPADLQRELVDLLIEELLVAEEARARHLEVTSEDVDRAVQAFATARSMTVDALLAEAARDLGLDRAAYRDEVRRQLLAARWERSALGETKDPDARAEARRRALAALRARHHVEVRP